MNEHAPRPGEATGLRIFEPEQKRFRRVELFSVQQSWCFDKPAATISEA
jgi:hypothetical protein